MEWSTQTVQSEAGIPDTGMQKLQSVSQWQPVAAVYEGFAPLFPSICETETAVPPAALYIAFSAGLSS